MVGFAAASGSFLGVVDLLGETRVFDAAYAYMGFIRDLGPHNNTASTEGQQVSAGMKEAMSKPLTGEEAKLAN